MTLTSVRTLVVTDNRMSATAIRQSLRRACFAEVLGYVNSRRPLAEHVAGLRPDVVLFDEGEPGDGVLLRISEARAMLPDAKLVLLAPTMDPAHLAEAVERGLDAAIRRTIDAVAIGGLVREIVAGNVMHVVVAPAAAAPAQPLCTDLTTRELQILRLVAAGCSNAVIGRELWVTEQTVKFHLSNVYRKLGVANRTAASHYAHVHGLLMPEPGGAPTTTERESIRAAA
jgi:DNA-binding NarL/FixJ family response regulator